MVQGSGWMGSLIKSYGEWDFGLSEDEIQDQDKRSRFFPTQVVSAWRKLSGESKFIFSTTWKAVICRVLGLVCLFNGISTFVAEF